MTGVWRGTLVADAVRAPLLLEISGPANRPVVALDMTIRGNAVKNTADSVQVSGDSVRFSNAVGGPVRIRFEGVVRADTLVGRFVVSQPGATVAEGVWQVRRSGGAVGVDPRSPLGVFDAAWTAIDEQYGNFSCKKIDWDAVRRVYRRRIRTETAPDSLFGIIGEMLSLLNDSHVSLRDSAGGRRFQAGAYARARTGEFSLAVVQRSAVRGGLTKTAAGSVSYGWLADSIGYIHLAEFGPPRPTAAAIDSALSVLQGARGLILDIRDNRGGSDQTGQLILNRLADSRRHYMTMRARALPPHDSYLTPREWRFEPVAQGISYTRPIYLLTNRRSISAADNFALGAKLLPHLTIVGDVTTGAYADITRERLPNGWELVFPLNTTVDARGTCWEGAGTPPDVWVVNDPAEVARGKDQVLATAHALLTARLRP